MRKKLLLLPWEKKGKILKKRKYTLHHEPEPSKELMSESSLTKVWPICGMLFVASIGSPTSWARAIKRVGRELCLSPEFGASFPKSKSDSKPSKAGEVGFLVMYAMNWSTVSSSSLELEFYTSGISSFVVNPTTYAFCMDPHPLYEFSALKRKRAFIWLINFTYNLKVILFIWTRIKQFQIRYRK